MQVVNAYNHIISHSHSQSIPTGGSTYPVYPAETSTYLSVYPPTHLPIEHAAHETRQMPSHRFFFPCVPCIAVPIVLHRCPPCMWWHIERVRGVAALQCGAMQCSERKARKKGCKGCLTIMCEGEKEVVQEKETLYAPTSHLDFIFGILLGGLTYI